jgi:hypothetical protein
MVRVFTFARAYTRVETTMAISRREFIGTGATAAAGLALGQSLAAQARAAVPRVAA